MSKINWSEVEGILEKALKASIFKLSEDKYVVNINEKIQAIIGVIDYKEEKVLGIALRASVTPNTAALLAASLATHYLILLDDNFEYDSEGESLIGEEALEYVFGKFYDKKLAEKMNKISKPTLVN